MRCTKCINSSNFRRPYGHAIVTILEMTDTVSNHDYSI